MLCIVLDTNILNSGSKDYSVLQFVFKLQEIIRELEASDYEQTIKVLLPEIVVNELIVHQIEHYVKDVSKLKGMKFPGVELIFQPNYEKFVHELLDNQIKQFRNWDFPTEIIPYPSGECLSSIINRSIDKRPPFEGQDRQSDKGFKDVIIWESILDYKRRNPDSYIILFSGDGRLTDEALATEYENEFHSKIELIRRENDNDNRPLYDAVSRLIPRIMPQKETRSLSETLKDRVLSVINESNLRYIFIDNQFAVDSKSFVCKGLSIQNKAISSIDDLDDGRITQYRVISEMLLWDGDRESSGEHLIECEFLVEYYIDDNTLYLRSYDSFEVGYNEYEYKEFTLKEYER